ncbi:MAG: CRISPR-associated endonuclease Cas6 [Flavobacteriaceae bacterium]|nr:CRISPR-associated endonuclease Cas6 [Flavobacteriaceae bacterium]
MHQLQITTIKFPQIQLKTRDAHKLRGFFGELFKEYSPLLHNHFADGTLRYKYPDVQYKVINSIPILIGVKDGAKLLPELFLKIQELDIDGTTYPINSKNIESRIDEIGYTDNLIEYEFQTLWMPLNQENYPKYLQLENEKEQRKMLNSILTGHILGFLRTMEVELEINQRIMCMTHLSEKSTQFKNNQMLAFAGTFSTNILLPDLIGIGKSVSRGFGTIKRV